jgi:putative urate catabolism protein
LIDQSYAGVYGHPARDLVGYAGNPPDPKWPGGASIAVNFVINYEEGGENCLLHGDKASENLLSEIVGAAAYEGQRHMNMESLYDYGARAGFWRLHRIFTERSAPCTVYAVGMALERNQAAADAMVAADWEIASHGFRWIDYQNVPLDEERLHIEASVEVIRRVTGKRPVGIYQGKPNENTRKLVVEEGGFLYDSDAYSDDLPFWNHDFGKPHLIIPYTLVNNDMIFVRAANFPTPGSFYEHLKAAFDELYDEGEKGAPKMMSIGLHCRTAGMPGRAAAVAKFLDYVQSHDRVWVTTREDIAHHWHEHHKE